MKSKYDKRTQLWFDFHPFAQTTVMRCEWCGLFYKPSLGHTCKKAGGIDVSGN